ncbi:MAG: mechanosensitive ion channel family protein [Candidatus Nanohalarchaeota archaeon]|nr:MAG: mechanosensitive ion channel family protein [Candidatus Nanohaloarchaeota archaeon]
MDLNMELLSGLFAHEMMATALIILATFCFAHLVDRAFFRLEGTSSVRKKIDPTRQRVLRKVIQVLIYIIGIVLVFYSIPELRAVSVGMFAGVGVIGIVVGFAAQETLANLVAGVSLAVFQPFRLGDRLRISKEYGIVEDITLRHTVIRTWENKRIVIPNHVISQDPIVNYSIGDDKILKYLDVSISYDSDIDLARRIMMSEVKKHPDVLDINTSKDISSSDIPVVRMRKLTDSGVTLRLLFWAPDQSVATRTGYELLESIKKRFDKEGVEIPYPYLTIVYKKDLPKTKHLNEDKKK